MISKILVNIGLPDEIKTANIGSLLHGCLMEWLPEETVSFLHQYSTYSPLKQRLLLNGKKVQWEIVVFNDILFNQIEQTLTLRKSFRLHYNQKEITIEKIEIQQLAIEELVKKYFSMQEVPRYVKLNIQSPTSFKSNGQYDIFPDLKKIFRSIMRNTDTFFPEYRLFDGDTLEYLVSKIKIVNYQLRSTKFHLEGIKIPSFQGNFTVQLNGPLPVKQLSYFLLTIGQWTGIGIKTSLGMGKYFLE